MRLFTVIGRLVDSLLRESDSNPAESGRGGARTGAEHVGGILSFLWQGVTNAITGGLTSRNLSIKSAVGGFWEFVNYSVQAYCDAI